jgi:DedD protein
MPDDTAINLDDLRRRARRRLIGAVVLALAAAVVVPMLLESEQKPLGEDVAVKIPPVDDGKFVTKLPERGAPKTANAKGDAPKPAATDNADAPRVETPGAEAPKAEAPKSDAPKADAPKPDAPKAEAAFAEGASAGAPVPRRTVGEAEQRVLGGTKAPVKAEPQAPPAPAAAPPPPPVATNTPAPEPAAANATAKPSVAPAQPAPAAEAVGPGFSVQLAAFSDDKGANALANKLKRAGYPAYTEPLATSKGTLWRVRVGPYNTRDLAVEGRDRLKGDGYSGIVTATK